MLIKKVREAYHEQNKRVPVGAGMLALLHMSSVVYTLIFDTYKNGIKYLPDAEGSDDHGTNT